MQVGNFAHPKDKTTTHLKKDSQI